MHYKYYSTEDFIQDEFFQQWVLTPTAESNHYWSIFLLHHPLQRNKIEEARVFILAMKFGTTVPESFVLRTRMRMNAAIDALEAKQQTSNEPAPGNTRPTRSVPKFFYPVAASVLFALFTLGYFVIPKDKATHSMDGLLTEVQQTPKGKKQHMVLQDGTEVWLNANSVLRYDKDFSHDTNREVYLEGEAFFVVTHDEKRPFIVHTCDIAIKVLGTTFNVRSYAEDEIVETTLVQGKVTIASGSEHSMEQVTLLPNQQALFRKESHTIQLEKAVNTEAFTGWKNGWMIFEDKPFSYIKETLERWYDVSIVMEDEHSLSCAFSAKFKDKTLLEVLEIFRNTESISYQIKGNRVLIEGRLCEY